MIKQLEIEALLRVHYQTVDIMKLSTDKYAAEFGGELPTTLVEQLVALGADIHVYHLHRADVSTVVTF